MAAENPDRTGLPRRPLLRMHHAEVQLVSRKNKKPNRGFWTDNDCDLIVRAWVEILGPLPRRAFKIEVHEGSAAETLTLSATEKLHHVLKTAQLKRHLDPERGVRNRKESITALRTVESAARRLLMRLTIDKGDVLRNLGKEVLLQKIDGHSALKWKKLESLSAHARVQLAVDGVDEIRSWAAASATRLAALRHEVKDLKKFRGDVGLSSFMEEVVQHAWCEVWGLRIADGPRFYRFLRMALEGLGEVDITDEALRERARRVFDLRAPRGGRRKYTPSSNG